MLSSWKKPVVARGVPLAGKGPEGRHRERSRRRRAACRGVPRGAGLQGLSIRKLPQPAGCRWRHWKLLVSARSRDLFKRSRSSCLGLIPLCCSLPAWGRRGTFCCSFFFCLQGDRAPVLLPFCLTRHTSDSSPLVGSYLACAQLQRPPSSSLPLLQESACSELRPPGDGEPVQHPCLQLFFFPLLCFLLLWDPLTCSAPRYLQGRPYVNEAKGKPC